MAFISTLAAKYGGGDTASNLCWAARQINLMIGGSGAVTQYSFVVVSVLPNDEQRQLTYSAMLEPA
jgi:hypothetical protein